MFLATSAAAMEYHINNNKSANFLYLYMAQILNKTAPLFCISIFGTNNFMFFKDVIKRQAFITTEVKEKGIQFLGFSADGDSRILKAMLLQMKLGKVNIASQDASLHQAEANRYKITGFCAEISPKQICIHI